MNSRERFLRITQSAEPDRLRLWSFEGFSEQAIRLWCQQGFPLGRNTVLTETPCTQSNHAWQAFARELKRDTILTKIAVAILKNLIEASRGWHPGLLAGRRTRMRGASLVIG